MKTSRLLYLSAHQMTAYRWHSGELAAEGLFATTAEGHLEFAAYLAQHRDSIFSLLANVSEEGFHIETIPFLRGADRQAVIARKLAQLFFNATLTASLSLGYQKSKRKDERVMLAALTNNDFFAPWLSALAGARVALAGIYSLPLLAPALLRRLALGEGQCLLLTVQDQSIRQSYFDKGELHFSRLSPLTNSSIGGIAQAFSGETIKLQQYLASQRLIGRGQPITAHVLVHPGALRVVQNSCVDSATIRYNFLNIEDCAKKTGLKTLPPDTHSEQLFLNVLATSPPRIQFADDERRHVHHLGQIRSGLQRAGAAALIACLLFAATIMFDSQGINREAATLQNAANASRRSYDEVVKTFPPIPTDNTTLRRVIDRYVELEAKTAAPDGLYHEISRALQVAPAAEIERLDWKVGGGEATSGAVTAPTPGVAPLAADNEAIVVVGTLRLGANANARQMLAAFDRFIETLAANPKLRVDVLQRPFDIEPGKSLKGGDTTLEDNKPRSFSVHVSRKIGS